jgi:predicted TIM-barrel fold metal-dependent hydrolase
MDAAGINLQVLSHVQPGVQTLDRDTAIRMSIEINDWLGTITKKYPTRFAGFAMLPTQSPKDAADELQRTVTQLGFKGALINGHTYGRYMDDISFSPIFERAQALDVPIYIHPTDPPQAVLDTYYKDYYPAMTQSWGWQVETGTHLLRMMSGGVFGRYPRLKIIVGHMGELIPFALTRINTALTFGNWLVANQSKDAKSADHRAMQQSVFYYMKENVFITNEASRIQSERGCPVLLTLQTICFFDLLPGGIVIGRAPRLRRLHRDVAFRAGNYIDIPVGLVPTEHAHSLFCGGKHFGKFVSKGAFGNSSRHRRFREAISSAKGTS